MQLVAYGAQDIYLTGNPQITFFKVVYRRHTNFAMESIEQVFDGTVGIDKTVTATIARQGDLISRMWIEIETPVSAGNYRFVDGIGNAFIKQVDLEIGGQLIDRHYAEWLAIWGELSTPAGKLPGYDQMTGTCLNSFLFTDDAATHKLDVPLIFWFNTNPGLALPLIALQYHEVKLKVIFNDYRRIIQFDDSAPDDNDFQTSFKAALWIDYIYLDTDERRRFAQVSHEYLIEQLQYVGNTSFTNNRDIRVLLNFNHPCKEIIWTGRARATGEVDDIFIFNTTFETAKLQLNGTDRFKERRPEYFLNVQNYSHHTRVPRYNLTTGAKTVYVGETPFAPGEYGCHLMKIYTYSFAIHPEEHQPSGTCNFSRIDNSYLIINKIRSQSNSDGFTPTGGDLLVFAKNYNVLRIMSGMGGLAFSN